MGCCLVAALLVSLGRKAWTALSGRPPAPPPFPPAARRPAPGQVVAPSVTPPRPDRTPALAPASVAALVVLVYAATSAGLAALGLVGPVARPAVGTLPRDLLLATLLAGCLVVAVRTRPRSRTSREHRGRCLVAGGLTWTLVLVVDVHVLGHTHATTLPVDVGLHVAGLVALYAGLLLWQPLAARRHPAHPEGARA